MQSAGWAMLSLVFSLLIAILLAASRSSSELVSVTTPGVDLMNVTSTVYYRPPTPGSVHCFGTPMAPTILILGCMKVGAVSVQNPSDRVTVCRIF